MKWLLLAPLCSAFFFFGDVAKQNEWLVEYGLGIQTPLVIEQGYSFVTWNVYKGQKAGLHDDLSRLIEENDFVIAQEFLLEQNQQKQIETFADIYWGFARSFQDTEGWTGVATISKHQPYESIPLQSTDTEPIAGTPKMTLVSKYLLEDDTQLWIVNIHSLNFDPSHSSFMNQLDEVVAFVRDYDGAMIFAGDFNTWSSTRRQYLIKKMAALSMERAPIESPNGFFSETLDHIFYRGIDEVEPELLADISSSDHIPLKISFFLKKKEDPDSSLELLPY